MHLGPPQYPGSNGSCWDKGLFAVDLGNNKSAGVLWYGLPDLSLAAEDVACRTGTRFRKQFTLTAAVAPRECARQVDLESPASNGLEVGKLKWVRSSVST